MTAVRLALVCGLLAGAVSAPAAEKPDAPLERLRAVWSPHASFFADPQVGWSGQLRVKATDGFLGARPSERSRALEGLAESWRSARPEEAGRDALLEVRWDHGGWLWRSRLDAKSGRENLSLVDRWDDGELVWMQESSSQGKWFLFLGGQSVSGGQVGSSSGLNVRLGSTLFRDKYDAAITFNQTSTGQNPKIKLQSVGFLGRALFRVPNTALGYNLGGQIASISGENFETEQELSLLAGLNYYMSKGAWDLALNLGDEGTRTLVVGYSIFLNR
jgi:hypothetical protein